MNLLHVLERVGSPELRKGISTASFSFHPEPAFSLLRSERASARARNCVTFWVPVDPKCHTPRNSSVSAARGGSIHHHSSVSAARGRRLRGWWWLEPRLEAPPPNQLFSFPG